MAQVEKQVSYTIQNSYSTLNELSNSTKNIWFVCHGMGYLSRYFLKYFAELDPSENYIIAPQAQGKYYVGTQFKHVGASWLTKENTVNEIENVLNYFDEVLAKEALPNDLKFIVLGYSQGVSVAARYVARRKIACDQLVFLSGRIPAELTAEDFKFLANKTKVSFIYGDKDQYLNDALLDSEKEHFTTLFAGQGRIIEFQGKHEVPKALIKTLI